VRYPIEIYRFRFISEGEILPHKEAPRIDRNDLQADSGTRQKGTLVKGGEQNDNSNLRGHNAEKPACAKSGLKNHS
jgi:hypothetical protein